MESITAPLRTATITKLLSCNNDKVEQQKINKNNVQNLVEQFQKFNHNEKLLFLINIQHHQNPNPNQSGTSPKGANNCDHEIRSILTNTEVEQHRGSPCNVGEYPRLTSTTTWLLSNFTSDMTTALPKEEVYDFYLKSFNSKPISTADFGKLMRQVFPEVKARRLGQRGASKYCYANIRKKSEYDLEKPIIPEIKLPNLISDYLNWGKQNFNIEFSSLSQLLAYLKSNNLKASNNLRKRRASSTSGGGGGKKTTNNKEDQEIKKYFNTNEWPQLRNLLSNNEFLPIGNNNNNNKKRHCSTNFIKPAVEKDYFRSSSVPIFDRFPMLTVASSSADSGYDSVNSNTPIIIETNNQFNPLLSSVGPPVELLHTDNNNTEDQGAVTAAEDQQQQNETDHDNNIFDSVFDLIINNEQNIITNSTKIFDNFC